MLAAFREIRELIVDGRMSPWALILEVDPAGRLNMSRTPVRAAIHWLQREAYVLEQQRFGKSRMVVAPLTKEDANELFMMIGRIECIAGHGAAQQSTAKRRILTNELQRNRDWYREALTPTNQCGLMTNCQRTRGGLKEC